MELRNNEIRSLRNYHRCYLYSDCFDGTTDTIKYLFIVTIGLIAWAVLAEMRRKNRLRQQQINRLQEQVAEHDRKIEMLQEQQGQNAEEMKVA